MAIFYGGIAQVIVGIMEWKKNNSFGMLSFGSFGFFWISFAAILMLPVLGLAKGPQPVELAAFLAVWAIFARAFHLYPEDAPCSCRSPWCSRPACCPARCSTADRKQRWSSMPAELSGIIAGALALYMGMGH